MPSDRRTIAAPFDPAEFLDSAPDSAAAWRTYTAGIVAEIRAWHRKREFAMETRKRADLALGSNLRSWLGWRRDLDPAEADRIKRLAAALIDCGEKLAKGKTHPLAGSAEWAEFGEIIQVAVASRAPTDAFEAAATKAMDGLAQRLPVWRGFAEHIRGFGPRSLAVIVGETGDLSDYASHSKLWKRMGLAVIDGARQGSVPKGLPREARAAAWIARGYSPSRRAKMFVIGDVLVKQNRGDYRAIYDARKAYERAMAEAAGLTVAPAAKIPKKRAAEFVSDGTVHLRAQRYMEKRLLRDLWRAWRRADYGVPKRAVDVLPSAELAPPLAVIDPDDDPHLAGLPGMCGAAAIDAECCA